MEGPAAWTEAPQAEWGLQCFPFMPFNHHQVRQLPLECACFWGAVLEQPSIVGLGFLICFSIRSDASGYI